MIGSGVIVDPEGYIVTNAHVVKGAEKIEVIVPPPFVSENEPGDAQDAREQTYDARIIGVTRQLDLAVIKIEAHELPAIPIRKGSSQGKVKWCLRSEAPKGFGIA